MEISGSSRIPASRAAVWAALEDPEILLACLPGSERLAWAGENVLEGAGSAKVGPVRAELTGRARRVEASAPERAVWTGEATGGAAGSAKGRTELSLSGDGDGTIVSYTVTADVDGKIGQLGSRMLNGFARQTAEAFFTQLAALAEAGALTMEPPLADAPPLAPEPPAEEPAAIAETPPLVAGMGQLPTASNPIAPTAVPAAPDSAEAAAAADAEGTSSGAWGVRVLVVAAIVVIVGAALYYALLQTPV